MIETRKINGTTTGNTLSGFAVLYDVESRTLAERGRVFKEVIKRGAFDIQGQTDDIKLFYQHDTSMPLARTKGGTLKIYDEATGLRFEADLPDTQLGRDVKELLTRGVLTGEMSFGFQVIKDSWNAGNTMRQVEKARISEISIVVDAAYKETSSSLRSINSDITKMRIESYRRKTK